MRRYLICLLVMAAFVFGCGKGSENDAHPEDFPEGRVPKMKKK